jgi:GGDEF domain-containing protein
LAQSRAGESAGFSFVMFDVNNFKQVNELFGHSKGDQVLRQLAFVLKTEAAADRIDDELEGSRIEGIEDFGNEMRRISYRDYEEKYYGL